MNRSDIDSYLKELGKALRKRWKKSGFVLELVVVGGAAIILNYNFRESTMDIDAYSDRLASIEDSIHEVQEKYNLSEDWLNSDFRYTSSFTKELRQFAKFYKTYGNVLRVYTISEEYMICMKLVAFRTDRHDLADIVGIIEHSPNNISYEQIDRAMIRLYGGWKDVKDDAKIFIKSLYESYDEVAATKECEVGVGDVPESVKIE